MKEQYKIWQNEWRQIMGKPINVDVEINCDFDLHFDIWELDKTKFLELFNSFPKGMEIGNNAYNLRNGLIKEFKQKLNKDEIISETLKAIKDIREIAYTEELNNPNIFFRTGRSISDINDLNYSERISIGIDDQMHDFIKKLDHKISTIVHHPHLHSLFYQIRLYLEKILPRNSEFSGLHA